MNIKKNEQGTYDISGVSLGKLMSIANSIGSHTNPTNVARDIKNIIETHPEYKEDVGRYTRPSDTE